MIIDPSIIIGASSTYIYFSIVDISDPSQGTLSTYSSLIDPSKPCFRALSTFPTVDRV